MPKLLNLLTNLNHDNKYNFTRLQYPQFFIISLPFPIFFHSLSLSTLFYFFVFKILTYHSTPGKDCELSLSGSWISNDSRVTCLTTRQQRVPDCKLQSDWFGELGWVPFATAIMRQMIANEQARAFAAVRMKPRGACRWFFRYNTTCATRLLAHILFRCGPTESALKRTLCGCHRYATIHARLQVCGSPDTDSVACIEIGHRVDCAISANGTNKGA